MSGGRKTRSAAAKAWQHFYNSAAWKNRRWAQLSKQPLCERCKDNGKIVTATVVHHVVSHKGNWQLFIQGELRSSCKTCHDSIEQSIERTGYEKGCTVNGRPVDKSHPWNM